MTFEAQEDGLVEETRWHHLVRKGVIGRKTAQVGTLPAAMKGVRPAQLLVQQCDGQ